MTTKNDLLAEVADKKQAEGGENLDQEEIGQLE